MFQPVKFIDKMKRMSLSLQNPAYNKPVEKVDAEQKELNYRQTESINTDSAGYWVFTTKILVFPLEEQRLFFAVMFHG